MERLPLISVIITVYERDKFIIQALNSVLNQTLDNDKYEVIVVGKLENRDIIESLMRERITFVENREKPIGLHIIDALRKANGYIISFLDDDDLFHKDKLEIVLDTFTKDKSLGFMSHPLHIINEEGDHDSLSNTGYERVYIDKNVSTRKRDFLKAWAQGREARYTSSTVSILKDILIDSIEFLRQVNSSPDSFYPFASYKSKYNMLYSEKNLGDYRLSITSLSKNISGEENFLQHKRIYTYNFCLDYLNYRQMLKDTDLENFIEGASIFHKIYYNIFSNDKIDKRCKITIMDMIRWLTGFHDYPMRHWYVKFYPFISKMPWTVREQFIRRSYERHRKEYSYLVEKVSGLRKIQ
ncbi:MAG: glycosyltransferase family 2 protein [Metallosphaera prunae]|uniref:glycosyltransferase family 2 protein n=1 Tax=Metallosphaera prunae TaxID=47304 RepID=UPI0022753BE9|nr:glycosyltransferase family 2 protein [Metallosphaera prunae]MCY0863305.1 glycosyltransferase family 2 protein [Metallosphaera prunae]